MILTQSRLTALIICGKQGSLYMVQAYATTVYASQINVRGIGLTSYAQLRHGS